MLLMIKGGVETFTMMIWQQTLKLTALVLLAMALPVQAAVQIIEVSPMNGWNSTAGAAIPVQITVTGRGFLPGLSVSLSRFGEPSIEGTFTTFTSTSEVTAAFDLRGARAGRWDVAVLNPDLSFDLLKDGFGVKEAPTIERIAAWGGPVQAMEVREREVNGQMRTFGYVARGSGMVILDVTDPSNMIELSNVDLESSGVYDIAVQGDYAYVCGRDSYISVIDVSVPTSPRLVATRLTPDPPRFSSTKSPTDIVISGTTAYVLFRWNQTSGGDLFSWDISDPEGFVSPATATFQGQIKPAGMGDTYALAVQDTLLYVAAYNSPGEAPDWSGIYVFDADANPFDPPKVGYAGIFAPLDSGKNEIGISNDRIYVTIPNQSDEWKINAYDLADPMNPSIIGLLTPNEYDFYLPRDIHLANGLVFIGDFDGNGDYLNRRGIGLSLLDSTADPADSPVIGSLHTRGAIFGVTVHRTTVYLFDRADGVVAVDVSDPTHPVRLGNWHSPAYFRSIDIEDNTLFISDRLSGITALNISVPHSPALLGIYQPLVGGNLGEVKILNGYAYFAASYDGLEVVDVSDPTSPVLVGGVPPLDRLTTTALALKNDILVASELFGSSSRVFDITDPSNPIPSAILSNTPEARSLALSDEGLLVGWVTGGCGHFIYDLSDPYDPLAVEDYCENHFLNSHHHIVVVDQCVYAVKSADDRDFGNAGLYVYGELGSDLTISQKSFFDIRGAEGVDIDQGIAYVTGAPVLRVVNGNVMHSPATLVAVDVTETNAKNNSHQVLAVAEPPARDLRFVKSDYPYVFAGGRATSGALEGSSMITFRVQTPGSVNADGDVDLRDFAAMQNCFGMKAGSVFNRQCISFDNDDEEDIDLFDFRVFNRLMTDPLSK